MRKILLVLFVNICCMYSCVQHNNASTHREFHVSVSGNDENDGSYASPFKTISAASQIAMPGDVITVHEGVYREKITPPRGGDSDDKRITYQAAKGERVEIKGSEVITGWSKLNEDTWVAVVPNSLFGEFNPYSDLIKGDWFTPTPSDRIYHTGAVYLNSDWLMEAASKDEVINPPSEDNPLWWAEVDEDNTTIWAHFKGVNPNDEFVEINVRETVFYPDRPFINYITIRGFHMEHAATNWAPPTAEQPALVGTHWSKGWIIEDNVIQYSKCSGISLGKYGDEYDNNQTESASGYVGTINRALKLGWNKGTIGSHIVRNNKIAYCEQTGIVGSMGCAFSVIEGNVIHDIHIRRLFHGAEMAAIKFHGAVDVEIKNNHIYRSEKGLWMDWMTQGTQIVCNLMYENDMDIFLEVNHGPTLVANNLLLSKASMLMNTKGVALIHNVFGGVFNVVGYDARMTPHLLPHSTEIVALNDNAGGDVQLINNLFVMDGNSRPYDRALLPVYMTGNVYTKGTNLGQPEKFYTWEMITDEMIAKTIEKESHNELDVQDFDAEAKIIKEGESVYFEVNLDKSWIKNNKRELATTESIRPALIPNLEYVNPDGSVLKIDTDYLGKERNVSNPSPGAFEITSNGKQRIKVW